MYSPQSVGRREPGRPGRRLTPPKEGEGWYAAQATCDICGYSWTAVYPEVCHVLECAKCGHTTRAPHLVEVPVEDEREPWQGVDDAGQDR